jgi:hypothetical protein
LVEQLLVSQEGHCSMEVVKLKVALNYGNLYTVFTRIKDDPAYKTTNFNFQENTSIRISQVFMPLIVYIFNILELYNYLS